MDAQKLNPVHSLREAMNPLRQMGNDIKADLQRAATPAVAASDPSMGLPEAPLMTPIVAPAEISPAPIVAPAPVAAVPTVVTEEVVKAKVARKPRAKAPIKTEAASAASETVTEKPKRAPRKAAAAVVAASDKPIVAPKRRSPATKKDNA